MPISTEEMEFLKHVEHRSIAEEWLDLMRDNKLNHLLPNILISSVILVSNRIDTLEKKVALMVKELT